MNLIVNTGTVRSIFIYSKKDEENLVLFAYFGLTEELFKRSKNSLMLPS